MHLLAIPLASSTITVFKPRVKITAPFSKSFG